VKAPADSARGWALQFNVVGPFFGILEHNLSCLLRGPWNAFSDLVAIDGGEKPPRRHIDDGAASSNHTLANVKRCSFAYKNRNALLEKGAPKPLLFGSTAHNQVFQDTAYKFLRRLCAERRCDSFRRSKRETNR
jgi:hypothetical protein